MQLKQCPHNKLINCTNETCPPSCVSINIRASLDGKPPGPIKLKTARRDGKKEYWGKNAEMFKRNESCLD